MKVHLWCPELAQNSGGIEAYSADWATALAELFGESCIRIYTKHDRSNELRGRWGTRMSLHGTGGVPLRFRTPMFLALITAAALRSRPDLIVSTHVNFSPAAAWLKRIIGSRYILTLHGVDVWDLDHRARQKGIADADLNIPISGFTAERVIREQGLTSDRFRILRCTVDATRFGIGPKPDYLLQRYGLSMDQRVILTVGRLSTVEQYKGHDRVLRVLAEVADQLGSSSGDRDALRYIIVGDGDDRRRLDALADELGVTHLVTFAGRVPAEELADHYRVCDTFVMPSTGEGFGIVFLEALACGKPVIAGNRDAASDALRDGELGVLVDPLNAAQLRDAVVSILNRTHPHPMIYQPDALRAAVIEHFSYRRFKETLAKYLREFFPELEQARA